MIPSVPWYESEREKMKKIKIKINETCVFGLDFNLKKKKKWRMKAALAADDTVGSSHEGVDGRRGNL